MAESENLDARKNLWRRQLTQERDDVNAQIQNLRKQIRRIEEKMLPLLHERDKLTRNLNNGRTFEKRSGQTDPFVVRTSDFVQHIVDWLNEDDFHTILLLSDRSSVSSRTIRDLVNGHRDITTLDTADRILTALGASWMASTLQTYENPRNRGRPPSLYYEE